MPGAVQPERRPGLELVPPPEDLPHDAAAPAEPVSSIAEPQRGAGAAEQVEAFRFESEPDARPEAAEPVSPDEAPPTAPPYAAVTKTPAPVPAAEPDARSPAPSVPPQEHTAATAPPHVRTPVPTATYKPPPGPTIPPGKPVRKVPNPELEGSDVSSVGTMPRRPMSVDIGGTRKRGKSSWIVTGALGLLALLVVAGAISWWEERRAEKASERATTAAQGAPSPASTRERQDALKLLMRDDAASVERAAAQLDDLVRRQPASAARADRALALALLSQQAADHAVHLETRAQTVDMERARAEAVGGDAARAAELSAEADTLRAEISPLRERAGRLLSEARAELDALPSKLNGERAATRARAWVQLVSGARADAANTAGAAAGGEDPWLALAAIVAGLPEGSDGAAHERVADQLEQLSTKHPDFVRPLLLAGRIRAGLGDGARALTDFERVLSVNPQHVEARRVRAEIAAAIPEGSSAQGGAVPGAGAAPPGPSPAVNGHSQGGNAPAVPSGR